ncbi:MAG: hypothetical protein DCC68_08065 [Planctomycetota bacterium]|nr:MAG: hypothetical protein DCC68_08065 [Planctomycetota bacterium]
MQGLALDLFASRNGASQLSSTPDPPLVNADADKVIAHQVARLLLQRLIGELRRARQTALRSQIDSPSIAAAVWNGYWPLLGVDERRVLSDGRRLCHTLEDLLVRTCSEDMDADCADQAKPLGKGGLESLSLEHTASENCALVRLARWFDELCEALQTASDASLAALALRLEGYDDRDVALRLGLGVRLVRRLMRHVRSKLGIPVLPR